MKLDNNYSLEGEKYQWTLSYESETKTAENGKKYTSKDNWYYRSIDDALTKYVDECLKPCESVKEVLQRIAELKETIKENQLKEQIK